MWSVRIQEMGIHEELMQKQGSYYRLYETQRKLEAYARGKERV